MITRRKVLSRGALAAGGAALLERFASVFTGTARAQAHEHAQHAPEAAQPVPRP